MGYHRSMGTDDAAVPGEAAAALRKTARGGRKRDAGLSENILDATLDELARVGYDRVTMDAIAARTGAAKTSVYRRWATKADLVLEALTALGQRAAAAGQLPDTGSLRGDLLTLTERTSLGETQRKLSVIQGVLPLAHQDLSLRKIMDAVCIEPWGTLIRTLLERAVRRGTVRADIDLDTLSRVVPSLLAYRAIVEGAEVDHREIVAIIDAVLIPAAMAGQTFPVNGEKSSHRD